MLPGCVLLLAFVDEMITDRQPRYGVHPLITTFHEFFNPEQQGGYALAVFFTLPACACLSYSVGVLLLSRKWRSQT